MSLPAPKPFESAHLRIVPVAAAHLPDLLVINGDDAVTRFLPYATWQSLADGEAWLARMQALAQCGTGQQWVLVRKTDSRVIGSLLLFKHDTGSARLELGYVLGREHWRRGHMHEAVTAACRHAFSAMNIRRIEAEVNPANAASCRLLEKVGFVYEGTMRQRWVNNKGVAYDTRVYGLLAAEWREPMHCKLESPNQPDVIALIAELDAYQDTLYPAEVRYALDLAALEQSNVLFVVARDEAGCAIGCGAIVLDGAVGELKRMYVRPAQRARGMAAQVLAELEAHAVARGCTRVQLETGPHQPEALAFYAKQGFQRCGAFGSYPEHPLSVFMEKTLGPHNRPDAANQESVMTADDRTFRTARVLPYPPAAVYAAFEAPGQLATWWGPAGFTNTFEVFEFQVGGRWVFTMHGPDGAHYPNESRFTELDPGRKVVIRHDCVPYFTLTVQLAPAPGGTQLTWAQEFDDAAMAAAVRHIVEPANEQNLDRLTGVLATAADA